MHPTHPLAAARRRTVLIASAAVLALTGLAGQAQAQAWPSKPIKLVVGFPPGGGIDAVARNLQPGLQEALGQQVIVEYKPGAGGVLAAGELTRTPADGYTILVANIGPFVLVPNMVSKKPYDPQKDFTYIHQTSGSGFIAAVPANHPANTLAEFVAWAKANPAKANFASGGAGSITHLNGEMLNQIAGTKLVHVPYKGSSPAVQDLIGGQTNLLVDVSTVLLQHIQSGRLKALYVTDAQRIASLPNVPTAKEAGYPGLETSGWQGIVGPAGMPKDVVARISKAISETLAKPDVRQKFAANGSAIMEKGPEEFTAFHTAEINRWVPVIKASGATLD
ncbi:MAG: tripartite tricarboxylate transporter substrate binding protein [Rhodoferax sp.]|nr:tripartite tricarboxylate transporter substrate binding protein [Rhodoferax sp.]MCB2029903.1 tripartite tricarboxylate transporter substrate binding protein [Rhodoferax sp.]MCP5262741.1 tripartite tricarboxylate transporter substrate binding protein [Rhodoferax sp.]